MSFTREQLVFALSPESLLQVSELYSGAQVDLPMVEEARDNYVADLLDFIEGPLDEAKVSGLIRLSYDACFLYRTFMEERLLSPTDLRGRHLTELTARYEPLGKGISKGVVRDALATLPNHRTATVDDLVESLIGLSDTDSFPFDRDKVFTDVTYGVQRRQVMRIIVMANRLLVDSNRLWRTDNVEKLISSGFVRTRYKGEGSLYIGTPKGMFRVVAWSTSPYSAQWSDNERIET